MSSQHTGNPPPAAAPSINPHIVQVFVPSGVRLYSVSMTCDYDEGPVTFRVNVMPKPRNNNTSLGNPGNGIPLGITDSEDVKDPTIISANTQARTDTKKKRLADDLSEETRDAPSGQARKIVPVPGVVPFDLQSKPKGFLPSNNASESPAGLTDDRIETKRYKALHVDSC